MRLPMCCSAFERTMYAGTFVNLQHFKIATSVSVKRLSMRRTMQLNMYRPCLRKYCAAGWFSVPAPGMSYHTNGYHPSGLSGRLGWSYRAKTLVVSDVPTGAAPGSLLFKPRIALIREDLPLPAGPAMAMWIKPSLYPRRRLVSAISRVLRKVMNRLLSSRSVRSLLSCSSSCRRRSSASRMAGFLRRASAFAVPAMPTVAAVAAMPIMAIAPSAMRDAWDMRGGSVGNDTQVTGDALRPANSNDTRDGGGGGGAAQGGKLAAAPMMRFAQTTKWTGVCDFVRMARRTLGVGVVRDRGVHSGEKYQSPAYYMVWIVGLGCGIEAVHAAVQNSQGTVTWFRALRVIRINPDHYNPLQVRKGLSSNPGEPRVSPMISTIYGGRAEAQVSNSLGSAPGRGGRGSLAHMCTPIVSSI
ncbi:uncharacterized protein B0H18DRAFT_1197337 [Fomitopsis serialis]|uniref:uncharacterized protein n=1 Tax=Fomitopsis serialis TaxID=139415 RepID=UPI002007393B|nr:uncharacterized protein B0H18DRAFT_1197337 [Neoantrodia serialis]KAH9905096.1 hypothetical protein B0H18DRAFT_1197337 [Neoantrodia serialis]